MSEIETMGYRQLQAKCKEYGLSPCNKKKEILRSMILSYLEDIRRHPLTLNIDIPTEILYEIALKMDVDDIFNYCEINKESRKICQTVQFWITYIGNNKVKFEGVIRKLAMMGNIHLFSQLWMTSELNIKRSRDFYREVFMDVNDEGNIEFVNGMYQLDSAYNYLGNFDEWLELPLKYQDIYNHVVDLIYDSLVPKHREILQEEEADRGIAIGSDDNEMRYYGDGMIVSANVDLDLSVVDFLDGIDEIIISFSYVFGTDIPEWPFQLEWSEWVTHMTSNIIVSDFPRVRIKSETDVDLQGIQIYISK